MNDNLFNKCETLCYLDYKHDVTNGGDYMDGPNYDSTPPIKPSNTDIYSFGEKQKDLTLLTTTYTTQNYSQMTCKKQLHEIFVFFKNETNAEKLEFDLVDSSISFVLEDASIVLKYNGTNYDFKTGLLKIENVFDIYFDEKGERLLFKTGDATASLITKRKKRS